MGGNFRQTISDKIEIEKSIGNVTKFLVESERSSQSISLSSIMNYSKHNASFTIIYVTIMNAVAQLGKAQSLEDPFEI